MDRSSYYCFHDQKSERRKAAYVWVSVCGSASDTKLAVNFFMTRSAVFFIHYGRCYVVSTVACLLLLLMYFCENEVFYVGGTSASCLERCLTLLPGLVSTQLFDQRIRLAFSLFFRINVGHVGLKFEVWSLTMFRCVSGHIWIMDVRLFFKTDDHKAQSKLL